LLNAIGHLARGGRNAPMLNNMIKKFEMMNVNSTIIA